MPGLLFKVDWPISAVGGVNEVVLSLANEAKKAGYQACIAAARAEPELVRGIEVIALDFDLPLTEQGSLRALPGFLARLPQVIWRARKLLSARDIQLVNAQFPELDMYTLLLMRCMRAYRGKIVLSFQGGDIAAAQLTTGIHRFLWRYLLRGVDAVTACSESLRQEVLAFAPRAKVTTVYNGADVESFGRSATTHQRGHTLLQVGKFERKKGQDVLLNAFSKVRRRFKDARLLLVGAAGPELQEIREQIRVLDLEHCTEMAVDVPHEDLPAIFSKADLFVLPSRAEPFGIVLVEAGAAGLPVVASRVGGIPELIENEVSGLLVPPDCPAELQAAIERLFEDVQLADRLASAWHARAVSQWTWSSMFTKLIALVDGP